MDPKNRGKSKGSNMWIDRSRHGIAGQLQSSCSHAGGRKSESGERRAQRRCCCEPAQAAGCSTAALGDYAPRVRAGTHRLALRWPAAWSPQPRAGCSCAARDRSRQLLPTGLAGRSRHARRGVTASWRAWSGAGGDAAGSASRRAPATADQCRRHVLTNHAENKANMADWLRCLQKTQQKRRVGSDEKTPH